VQQVLPHAEPDLSKPAHSVFAMQRREVLVVVDEAWMKRGLPLANDPGTYVVPMRPLGTAGESAVRIVVRPGTSELITAYPVHP
jgi:filamentous hemagglutinin